MTVNAKLDACAARIDALNSRFDRFAKRRMDAMPRPGHMERSLQKLGKSPAEAKQIATSIKAKTKKARSEGGSNPDFSPIEKDCE